MVTSKKAKDWKSNPDANRKKLGCDYSAATFLAHSWASSFHFSHYFLNSAEVFVFFLVQFKVSLFTWFSLFHRLCKWPRLYRTPAGVGEKKPRKKSIGRTLPMANPWQTRCGDNLGQREI